MITNEERRERRARLLERMRGEGAGAGDVALVQGAPKQAVHGRFRQHNDLMYLCGVETPHAYLAIDALDGASHLFLPYQPPHLREREGPLVSAADPDGALRATGVDAVHGLDELATFLERARVVWTPLRAGEGAIQSWDTLQRSSQERLSDPWDGRPDRHRWFVRLLRERLPRASVRDLAPLLDELRLVKSDAELALLRRSGRLAADALVAAMRRTRPGVFEYQLDAELRYVYRDGGARDVAYGAIVAGGDNAWYGHYDRNDGELRDGDLVLVDCGPDYAYYASDITRIWPVNGRYDALQRELYGFIVAYHEALLRRLRPGVTREQVQEEAAADMADVVERTRFSKPIYEAAARRALVFPHHLSHPVGMAVHDVGHYRGRPMEPGLVLTVDPQLIIPEERRYLRVEDTVAITAGGIENFTDAAPLDLDATEAIIAEGAASRVGRAG
jgi:Xaa-Pro aminopeptidase